MRRCHTLWVGFASTLTCLALLLGLFTQVETAQASSTPHITISGVSQLDPTCLTFQIEGRGFSAHSNVDIVAIEPNTGMNFQPDQVQTSKHGNFSTTAQACVPNNQGSSIQFFVRAQDGHTGKQSNTVHVSYKPSTSTAPSISISGVSLASPTCLTFQIEGLGFSANSTAKLVALAPGTGANIQPAQVQTSNSGDFSIEATACVPQNQGSSIQFSVEVQDGLTGKQSDIAPVTYDQPILPGPSLTPGCDPTESVTSSCVVLPTPAAQCPVGESQIPGSCQNQAILLYLTAKDEHTTVETAPYPVAYDGQPILPGSSPSSGAPTLFISNLSQESATCLTFRVMGEGFSHRLHVDLTGQDESQAAVALTPSRVLTDSNGAFSKKVQACGNFSESAGLGQVSLDWCNILFIADFFCNN